MSVSGFSEAGVSKAHFHHLVARSEAGGYWPRVTFATIVKASAKAPVLIFIRHVVCICLLPFIIFSVVSRSNGEVIGHLHLESVTAAEVDHRVEEDRVRAGWQRVQQDPVTVGDPVLRCAGYAGVEGHEGGIGCECEQPRRGAVTEQVVQGLPIHNDFEFRHEIDDRRGPFSEKLLQGLPGRRLKVGVRTGVVIEIGNDREEQGLAGRDGARPGDRTLPRSAGKEPDRAGLAQAAIELSGLQGRKLGRWERVGPTPPLRAPFGIAQAVGSSVRWDNSRIRIPLAPGYLARRADDQTSGQEHPAKNRHLTRVTADLRCDVGFMSLFLVLFCFNVFAFHRCTVRNPIRGYAEKWKQPRITRMTRIRFERQSKG